jgi:hypothetical protein
VSLEASKTKLVCLSYLGAGGNAAHVRYLVRRLRRILPEGATVLVGFWADEGGGAGIKALEATAEADAYVTSLKEAARFCVDAARGQEAEKSKAAPPPADSSAKDGKAPAPKQEDREGRAGAASTRCIDFSAASVTPSERQRRQQRNGHRPSRPPTSPGQ